MKIETARLVITEFTPDMAKDVHLNSLDEDNRRFVPDEVFETEEEAGEAIAFLTSRYSGTEGPLTYPVLTKAGVFKGWNEQPENDISRIAHCEALGQKFDIEWWINQCYLKIGHMQMMFHWVRVDTTWPWYQYRTELHFENSIRRWMEPGDTVAVLGIEYHKDYLEKHPELKGDETHEDH